MTDKVADDNDDYYDYYKVIPWIASRKSSDQKLKMDKGKISNYKKENIPIRERKIFQLEKGKYFQSEHVN
jgi:hypothetical protein